MNNCCDNERDQRPKPHNCRVIQRLDKFGVLDFDKTILGHCIHLDENERSILSDSAAWIAVNTESNLNNNVGLFSNTGGLEEKVLLGTDGMHSDMIRSAQINFFTHKDNDHLSFMNGYQRFRRVHNYIRSNGFSGDSANNMVILDYKSPTPVTADNWLGHFFYGLNSSDVDSVIANGKWVLKEKKLSHIRREKELCNTHNGHSVYPTQSSLTLTSLVLAAVLIFASFVAVSCSLLL